MTILTVALAILRAIQQLIAGNAQILAAQQQQAAQITDLQQSVDGLAATLAKQGETLDKILAAVESSPVGVTTLLTLGVPVAQ